MLTFMVESRGQGSVRERLLEAADELFYREGVHTVGIDRVLERAGVAKASLYGTFGSKDELVRAYLEGRSRRIRERTAKRLAEHPDPRAAILSVFDLLGERVTDGSFRGCAFVNACAEGPVGPTPSRVVSDEHRAWLKTLFARLAGEAGARDPVEASHELALLYDGALIGASMDASPEVAVRARRIAEKILEEHITDRPARPAKARPSGRRSKRET